MIRINLAPPEELESPLWWVPDAAAALTMAVLAWLGTQTYLGTFESEIAKFQSQTQIVQTSFQAIEPEVNRATELQASVETLRTKSDALRRIAISRIARYRPVIILEHLQNLRPEGLWFTQLTIGDADRTGKIELRGLALDNLLVAELLGAISATAVAEPEPSDLRTQVGFDQVMLRSAVIASASSSNSPSTSGAMGAQADQRQVVSDISFVAEFNYVEREPAMTPEAMKLSLLAVPQGGG